ncbi:MAG TPA: metal ABC transporter permease [Nevskiales bacterium]|nr:metal ABC transporter permease [Nevskiales bacterium]
MNLAFDWAILGAPLLAGLVVIATHVALGREVLRRGIIFIDLTVAQVAAVGVILAEMLEFSGEQGWKVQVAAGIAALLAAGLLAWTEQRWPQLQEALIGSLYVVAACAAILLLAHNPHGHEHLAELLAGQILWVNLPQVWPVAALSAFVLAAWFLGGQRRGWIFYFLFAITVMASVQLVGVFLVFASLILPALASSGLPERRGLIVGWGLGAVGYALGLWLSVPLDLPAGPMIVCTLAVLALLAAVARSLRR